MQGQLSSQRNPGGQSLAWPQLTIELRVAKTEGKCVCPICGTAFSEGCEFCPVCALRGALSPETKSLSDNLSEVRFANYTVLRTAGGEPLELGRGAMGVTYKAFDVHLQRPAALKIINPQLFGDHFARQRFVREARAAASVRHQNVASVFQIGESDGNYYCAMELVEGESLQSLIRRSGCLATDLALDILEQATAGLAAIEKQQLVHRDIKPSNIMVSVREGKLEGVKIIDLGLAKGVSEENTLSGVGAFVGTPAYASPEQFAGIATDIRSDLYSLGVTLWQMLTMKVPFGGSAAELMYQHQHAELPIERLKNVSAPAIALLQILLAKDPNRRFQTPLRLQKAITRVRQAVISGAALNADELRSAEARATDNLSKRKPVTQAIRWLFGAGVCLAIIVTASVLYTHHWKLSNQRPITPASADKSIAVLPFENISSNKDDAYFADGVQDEILNNLAKIAQLKVISRTSVMRYRGDNKRDLREIARALGVADVLEGTVRREGNRVRISTELVDAYCDNTIWADSYDRDLTNIFAIQSEIAQAVAVRLSAELSPKERNDIDKRPTENLEAYDLYLQAKQLITNSGFLSESKEAYPKAIALLKQAIQKDCTFALAYCLLAQVHDRLYLDDIDHTPERRALADAALNRVLRLRPDLPEVHLALASHLYISRDFKRARVQVAIAEQALPNSPDLLELTSQIDQVQGQWEQALNALERAATLDPQNPDILDDLVDIYFQLRQYPDAERTVNRQIELGPDKPGNLLGRAICVSKGRADFKTARAICETIAGSIKDDPGLNFARVCYAMSEAGFYYCRRNYQ